MENARPQTTETSALEQRHFNPSALSPRHKRIAHGLLARDLTRDEIDHIAGAANGPDEVMKLRSLGLDIPCTRKATRDRDGRAVQFGVYSTTPTDRRRLRECLARQRGTIDALLVGWLAFGVVCAAMLTGVAR